ncbi:Rid family detoxifying hydrolase [Xanthomonas hydrangeae]|uniref:RidA family protein n=1 Tax=Xanthomonas hydrangeae TaxID=2775159 RepID=UPI001E4C166D
MGSYSQGCRTGDLVFTSGQIGLDPLTLKLVEGGIEAQIRQTFANIKAICEAAGASLQSIVKLTVFLVHKEDWGHVNRIMNELFGDSFPSRTAVGVVWLPLDAIVEIEAVAATKSSDAG